MANRVQDIIQRGSRANQPAANTVATGTIYYVTDEEVTERSTGSAWEDISDAGNSSTHELLSATHTDSSAASVSRGSLIVGNSTPAWAELTVGTSGQVLTSDGTDATWQDATAADFSDVANQPEFIEGSATISWADVPGIGEGHIFVTIDNGSDAITTGVKGDLYIPFPISLKWVVILADQTGSSIVIDIWHGALGAIPTDSNSITASDPPTLTNSVDSTDTDLSTWTSPVGPGRMRFNVDSITTATRVQMILGFQREGMK